MAAANATNPTLQPPVQIDSDAWVVAYLSDQGIDCLAERKRLVAFGAIRFEDDGRLLIPQGRFFEWCVAKAAAEDPNGVVARVLA